MVPLLDDRSVRSAQISLEIDLVADSPSSSTDKLRIIALYIMFREGVPEGDKTRLYQHARLALHEMDAVNNLTYLGVNVSNVRLHPLSPRSTTSLIRSAIGIVEEEETAV